jgi:hypothetical protein
LSCKNIGLYSVYDEILLVVVEAQPGDEELLLSVLTIVAFNMEAGCLHEPNEAIETRARQGGVHGHEIQILADSMSEMESEGSPTNKSKAFQTLLSCKKLPNALRFRCKLAGIPGECF